MHYHEIIFINQKTKTLTGLTGCCKMDRFLLLQNLNTTAMDGGSVENVGTIFNHYVHVDNRINTNIILSTIYLILRNPLPKIL